MEDFWKLPDSIHRSVRWVGNLEAMKDILHDKFFCVEEDSLIIEESSRSMWLANFGDWVGRSDNGKILVMSRDSFSQLLKNYART